MVPASPAAYVALAICFLATGDVSEAEHYVERALVINDLVCLTHSFSLHTIHLCAIFI